MRNLGKLVLVGVICCTAASAMMEDELADDIATFNEDRSNSELRNKIERKVTQHLINACREVLVVLPILKAEVNGSDEARLDETDWDFYGPADNLADEMQRIIRLCDKYTNSKEQKTMIDDDHANQIANYIIKIELDFLENVFIFMNDFMGRHDNINDNTRAAFNTFSGLRDEVYRSVATLSNVIKRRNLSTIEKRNIDKEVAVPPYWVFHRNDTM
jgi:hypothetical protein